MAASPGARLRAPICGAIASIAGANSRLSRAGSSINSLPPVPWGQIHRRADRVKTGPLERFFPSIKRNTPAAALGCARPRTGKTSPRPDPFWSRSWCRKNPRQNRTRYFPEKPAAEPDPIFPVDGAGSGWAFAQIDKPRRPDRLPALGSPRPGRWRAPWASRPRKPPGGSPSRSDSAGSHANIRLNTPARRQF